MAVATKRSVARSGNADERRRAARADRHAARAMLGDASSLSRVRLCGKRSTGPAGVTVVATGSGEGRRSGFSGLQSCGSVWACPCCSAKVLAKRQDEITRALAGWTASGGRVVMLTLTMRHHDGQALGGLWDALSYAWGAVTSGRAWEDTQRTYGAPVERIVTRGKRVGQTVVERRVGWVRVVETTHGENGWHVHVHAALMVPGDTTERQADDLGCALFQPWRDALMRRGLAAPLARQGGLHAKLWDGASAVMGEYFTKNSYTSDASVAALELARGDLKTARAGHRTPFRILGDVAAFGVVDDLMLWHDWERASKRRAQMTWSFGLRAQLLPAEQEQTDEQIAAAADLAGDGLVVIPTGRGHRRGWVRVLQRGLCAQLLDAAERDTTGHALRRLLHVEGIEWKEP